MDTIFENQETPTFPLFIYCTAIGQGTRSSVEPKQSPSCTEPSKQKCSSSGGGEGYLLARDNMPANRTVIEAKRNKVYRELQVIS